MRTNAKNQFLNKNLAKSPRIPQILQKMDSIIKFSSKLFKNWTLEF